MEALDQPIALRMVGSGLLVADVQRGADSTPQARGELGTSVRRDDVWHAKTCHPFLQQHPGACGSRYVCHQECLRPPSRPVDDGEQVRGSSCRRQWSDKVHVDMGKTSVWHGNGLWKHVDVSGHLAALTCQTLTGPRSHLLG